MRWSNFRSHYPCQKKLILVTQSCVWATLHVPVVELDESSFDLVTDCSKNTENLCLTPGSSRRVGESNVQPAFHLAGEDGAILICVIANGDDVVKGILQKLTHTLRKTVADIDSNLLHHSDRSWVDVNRWLCACGIDFKVWIKRFQEPLRHLASG